MSTTRTKREERGIALLLTIFGLLLLTGITVAMLFSSDAETQIAVNYRDKQSAIYAAMSGVQEARDRLQPEFGDLSGFATVPGPGPTQLPGLNNGAVLYIINPNPTYNETAASIAPWAPTINGIQNPYFDKELCQEQYMATALNATPGTPGTPCTTTGLSTKCSVAGGGGTGWCTYYDDSGNNIGWKLKDANGNAVPLDYKWVRITLKADNSGLVYVQTPGTPANGTQVCWDTRSNQQLQLPPGAVNTCLGANQGAPLACAVAGANPPCAIQVNAGGSGYSLLTPPSVSFQGGGGGSGAAATATVSVVAGGISSASITPGSPGSGYTTPPAVTLVSPDGSGAALTALVTGSPITGVSVSGSNYCYAPTVTPGNFTVNFTPSPPGTGNPANATVTMTTTACVSGFAASASCSSMKGKSASITSVPGASGSGFSGTVNFGANGKVSSVSVSNVGNYTSVPSAPQTITVSGCTVTASFAGGIQISKVNLASGGQYITQPSASLTGPSPSEPSALQPTLTAAWVAGANNGQLSGIQVTSPGTGYAKPNYVLAFSGGGGSGAAGTATSSATGTVSAVTLTNAGANYSSAPTVVFGTPGAGASATAKLAGAQKLMLGEVYMLTSMAVTRNGSQAMVQMEAGVTPPTKINFQLGGALTIAGANPNFTTPNSANLVVNGKDANSCGEAAGAPLPAIGVANSAAQQCLLNGTTSVQGQTCSGLGKPNNYIGAQSAPDIQVDSGANPTPEQLQQLVTNFSQAQGAVNMPTLSGAFTICTTGCPTYTSLPATTTSSVTVVNGNLTLSGNPTGNGVLVVTGNLTLQGNFTWNGLILVLGSASASQQGGGNSQITGAMYIGNTNGGVSSFNWSGGGGNGIQYDHCLADDLLNNLAPLTSHDPLQVLSTRTLEF